MFIDYQQVGNTVIASNSIYKFTVCVLLTVISSYCESYFSEPFWPRFRLYWPCTYRHVHVIRTNQIRLFYNPGPPPLLTSDYEINCGEGDFTNSLFPTLKTQISQTSKKKVAYRLNIAHMIIGVITHRHRNFATRMRVSAVS